MSSATSSARREVERIVRVSDLLCSAHAGLRDHYQLLALWLDLGILALSTILAAVAFAPPIVDSKLESLGIYPKFSVGVLAVATFFATLFQLKVDWKARSEAHGRAFSIYAEVKSRGRSILASNARRLSDEYEELAARYQMGSALGIEIPENQFLKQKARHLAKVRLSQYLDSHPSVSILLARIGFWVRDNLSWCRSKSNASPRTH